VATRIGETEIIVLRDEPAVARAAAERTVAALRAALETRGTAHIALTGGSSAVSLYRELARNPWRDAIDWREVHMWWGDDRFVPRDHPESNAGLAYRLLFAVSAHAGESGTGAAGVDVLTGDLPGLIIDAERVHPIPAEEAIANSASPDWAALDYAGQIALLVPVDAGGVPAFDVILLGVGTDGHTLSVFAGSPALDPGAPVVMGIPAPEHIEPHLERVTLSTRVLPAASTMIVMSSGSSKAEMIANVLGAERDPSRWPAQAAILPNAIWYLDEGAASLLNGPRQT